MKRPVQAVQLRLDALHPIPTRLDVWKIIDARVRRALAANNILLIRQALTEFLANL